MPVNDNVEYNNLPTATEQRGMYSPPNGNHPQTLPDLWRDGDDIVRDDLPSLTDEQLNDLGWKGPIQMPPLSGTSFFTHTYEWNSETREWASFELSTLDKEKNVEYEKFWDLFIDTDFYNKLKTTASTKLATNVLYTEFIALLDDAGYIRVYWNECFLYFIVTLLMYEIIDNALPKEEFEGIKNFMLNPNFSWNLTPVITNEKENLPIHASFYFTHMFWDGFVIEPESQMFAPLLNMMDCRAIMRIKANCTPSTEVCIHHDNHCDYAYPHRGALFYINTNNGCTILEDKDEIKPVENRLLLFDPSKPHRSTTCTDDKCRINVNFNFF